jgi:hypothetical protein
MEEVTGPYKSRQEFIRLLLDKKVEGESKKSAFEWFANPLWFREAFEELPWGEPCNLFMEAFERRFQQEPDTLRTAFCQIFTQVK